MDAPLISVVTPSFQQARYLREALDSVLGQDYPSIEAIVVDGGSTDGSVDILRSYGERVRWVSEPDRGQAHALNKGFGMARGEILAWINSDDLMLPGAARLAAEALRADPSLGFVYGNGSIINERGERLERFPYTEPFNLWRLIHFGDTILQQSVFLRKSALDAVGGLDESLRWGLDWDLFLRLGKRSPALMLDADMGAIRIHADTKTASGGWARVRELGEVIRRHAGTRWTPSFAGVALEAAHADGMRLAGKLAGGFGQRLARLVHEAVARRVLPAMEECQGWLWDGWALPRLHALFPASARAGRLEIAGEAPQAQGLRLYWNGREASRYELRPGAFRLQSEAPDGPDGEPLHLEIRADRVIQRRPRYHGGKQELCYRLHALRLQAEHGALESLPPRRMIPVPDPSDGVIG